MNDKYLVYILQGAQLMQVLMPATLQLVTALQQIWSTAGPNFSVQVTTIRDGAIQDVQATLSEIEKWRQEHPQKEA